MVINNYKYVIDNGLETDGVGTVVLVFEKRSHVMSVFQWVWIDINKYDWDRGARIACDIWVCHVAGADPGGGGGKKLEKKQGAENHKHRKEMIKIGQQRSKIQTKTYPKTH